MNLTKRDLAVLAFDAAIKQQSYAYTLAEAESRKAANDILLPARQALIAARDRAQPALDAAIAQFEAEQRPK